MRTSAPILWLSCLALTTSALAQQPASRDPHIGYVYPAGGQRGTSFEVVVGGQILEGVSGATVSHPGVQARFVEYFKPMSSIQALKLRDQLKELQDKRRAAQGATRTTTAPAWGEQDEQLVREIQKKLATFVRRPSSPAIAEVVTLQVTVAEDAEPGQAELRLLTPGGLTNPLVFRVGQFPEFTGAAARYVGEPTRSVTRQELAITLPATVNGQILPGGVDRYRFQARRGQHLVVAVSARELIPYLPDAVPGWFQATVALRGPDEKELAYADDFRYGPDPVLFCTIPRDGEYSVEVKDAIYRGREDFVYRITLGEIPYLTGIYPLGGQGGTRAAFELCGHNLGADRLTRDLSAMEAGVYSLVGRRGEWPSNPVPFAVDTLPEAMEREPNDASGSAHGVRLPVIVNGRIGKPGDQDVFRLEGRAGDEVTVEVMGRRLQSPLDSTVRLLDATGKQLAFNDDRDDPGQGLITHHADSWLSARLPASGACYVVLADAQGKGGPEFAYRLRISAPRPDFALRVVPSAVNLRLGTSTPVTVHALRKDGFAGEIVLSLKDAPAGLVLDGGRIPAGQDRVRVTLTAPMTRSSEPVRLGLVGHARIGHEQIERRAEPADDMMQAFYYRHLVVADELVVAFTSRPTVRNGLRVADDHPVAIPVGGTARLRLAPARSGPVPPFELELSEASDGISLVTRSIAQGASAPGPSPRGPAGAGRGIEIEFRCDPGKVSPGLEGNLIVNLFTRYGAKDGASRRTAAGSLPAIPFRIVAAPSEGK